MGVFSLTQWVSFPHTVGAFSPHTVSAPLFLSPSWLPHKEQCPAFAESIFPSALPAPCVQCVFLPHRRTDGRACREVSRWCHVLLRPEAQQEEQGRLPRGAACQGRGVVRAKLSHQRPDPDREAGPRTERFLPSLGAAQRSRSSPAPGTGASVGGPAPHPPPSGEGASPRRSVCGCWALRTGSRGPRSSFSHRCCSKERVLGDVQGTVRLLQHRVGVALEGAGHQTPRARACPCPSGDRSCFRCSKTRHLILQMGRRLHVPCGSRSLHGVLLGRHPARRIPTPAPSGGRWGPLPTSDLSTTRTGAGGPGPWLSSGQRRFSGPLRTELKA